MLSERSQDPKEFTFYDSIHTEYKYRQNNTSGGVVILRTDIAISVTSGNGGYH